ncbi:hypothetical protein BdWA1_003207 [Babesia duncani]|uniref:Uncharacterized protein n=1 Tax=Babesia duncani TaxID=323732 RepID=A0AAD9PJ67_9APIC|nr:hypothetical protein BdWA1_003207 [Babesia duncani]
MSSTIALSLLYELLVAESRYEVRGNGYRCRLKQLYQDMLQTQVLYSFEPVKRVRQSINKYIEDLAASVGFLDCSNPKSEHEIVCPGIHQYLVPQIPNFNVLDDKFVEQWRDFFGTGLGLATNVGRGKRKRNPAPPSDSSGKGESANPDPPAEKAPSPFAPLITPHDILAPRMRPQALDISVPPKNPALQHSTPTPETRHQFPLEPLEPLSVGESIVFGLMNDEELCQEWACGSTYADYCSSIQESTTSFIKGPNCNKKSCNLQSLDMSTIFGNYYIAGAADSTVDDEPIQDSVEDMELVTCTLGDIQVHTTYYHGPFGIPRVKCVATLKPLQIHTRSPFNLNTPSLQDPLIQYLRDLYRQRTLMHNVCTLCNGWNVANGCIVSFCELCEAHMLSNDNLKPILKMFHIRRKLVSTLYKNAGYPVAKPMEEPMDALELILDTESQEAVSIQTLCEIGGTFPRATLHDNRLMPNYLNTPPDMLHGIYTMLYSTPQVPNYLFDIAKQRRNQMATMFDKYLQKLYTLYHSKAPSSRHPQLVSSYNFIFKSALVPQPAPEQAYFDGITSFILTRLPLDSNLLKRAFYHKGIYTEIQYGIEVWSDVAKYSSCDNFENTPEPMKLSDFMNHHHQGDLNGGGGTSIDSESANPASSWKSLVARHQSRVQKPQLPEEAHQVPNGNLKRTMELLKITGFLKHMPLGCLDGLMESKLYIGYPTTLEMHVMQIPNAILDPLLYGHVGRTTKLP